jgi:hypothetical protein
LAHEESFAFRYISLLKSGIPFGVVSSRYEGTWKTSEGKNESEDLGCRQSFPALI